MDPSGARSRFAAFRHVDFRRLQLARVAGVLALQVQSLAVAWQVLEVTHDPLALGAVGLAQFVPLLLATPLGGGAADRVDRRTVMALSYGAYAIACAALLISTAEPGSSLLPIYGVLILVGGIRAFIGPAASAMLADVVPAEDLPNGIAFSSSFFQLATVLGPALGGILYRVGGPALCYLASSAAFAAAALLVRTLRPIPPKASQSRSLLEGLRFVLGHRTLLAASSLDLIAVILSGAVALLPLVADELRIGPDGLGVLRSAPALGAALVGAVLAARPIERHAGVAMLGAVACFGATTIVFGLTRDPAVAFVALAASGAVDMVSVFVRQSLMQRTTPTEVRGRVAAVNLVFISASNELGEMESGLTARWLGVRPAIVAGGVAAILTAALYAAFVPSLRRLRLDASLTPLRTETARSERDGSRPS